MKKIALHWQIIIGLLLGVVWAVLSGYLKFSQFTIDWIYPFGEIFIRLLKLIAVPMVLFSIIKGITDLGDIKRLGSIGFKTLGIYLVTTIIAVSIGLLVVNIVQPGKFIDDAQRVENRVKYEKWVESNPNVPKPVDGQCYSCDEKNVLLLENGEAEIDPSLKSKISIAEETKEKGPLQFLVDMVPQNIIFSLSDNGLMLQIIFFALFFGMALVLISPDKSKVVIQFVDGANEAFITMVNVIMKAAPFFVFALLAGVISKMAGDNPHKIIEIFKGLSFYSLTVVLGLALMLFLFYPLMVKLLSGMRYKNFFGGIGPAQLLAFSTSSSVATLPVTIECVQDRLGVSKEVSSFVLPIGATVNMDGTSLYQAVAVVFLAQFHYIDLTFVQQLTIVLTATLASIGSAAVPSAGLIMMMLVLESVGLNPAWIAIIFPVDRILDMCRTVVNVTGDASVSTIIAKFEGKLTKT